MTASPFLQQLQVFLVKEHFNTEKGNITIIFGTIPLGEGVCVGQRIKGMSVKARRMLIEPSSPFIAFAGLVC